jgi:hypothetical protein
MNHEDTKAQRKAKEGKKQKVKKTWPFRAAHFAFLIYFHSCLRVFVSSCLRGLAFRFSAPKTLGDFLAPATGGHDFAFHLAIA